MSIKYYFLDKDNTITNAYDQYITTRQTSSNMGASDILETFVIADRVEVSGTYQNEVNRILLHFDENELWEDVSSSYYSVASSSFYLKMFNARHVETTPEQFYLYVHPITASRDWEEGGGMDMEDYWDSGTANWVQYVSGSDWTSAGGDFLTSSLSCYFSGGYEDLEIDISSFVTNWSSGGENNGLILKYSNAIESGTVNYYTKRFFSRTSEHFYRRPRIEVRYEDYILDDRGTIYISSSLEDNNTNNLYLYNYTKTGLKNIPVVGTGSAYVFLKDNSGTLISTSSLEASWEKTGIYKLSFDYDFDYTGSTIYDYWYSASDVSSTVLYSGSCSLKTLPVYEYSGEKDLVTSITNLKSVYRNNEIVKFRMFVRDRDANLNKYVSYYDSSRNQNYFVRNGWYKIERVVDKTIVVDYSYDDESGVDYSRLSYDKEGNYFNLSMDIFEPDYMYKISFMYLINGQYVEQRETFKFRVE